MKRKPPGRSLMNVGSNAASRGMAVLDRIRLTGPPAKFPHEEKRAAAARQEISRRIAGKSREDCGKAVTLDAPLVPSLCWSGKA
jgi:hypothetical protein